MSVSVCMCTCHSVSECECVYMHVCVTVCVCVCVCVQCLLVYCNFRYKCALLLNYCFILFIVFEKKDDRTHSFSDLNNVAAFKQLDCSCKIPHRSYPTADYEVPVATIQRSPGKLYQQGGKEDLKTPMRPP